MPDTPDAPATAQVKADAFERSGHGERTRRRIVEAAIRLFARRGFRGTGLAALAKEVGMSGPGLLYYFGTKERLLLDVVNERLEQERPVVSGPFELADLRNASEGPIDRQLLSQLFLVLGVENIVEGEPLHEFFVHRYRTNHQLARDTLLREREAGRCRDDVDVDQVATEMQAMTLGLELLWLTDPQRFDFRTRIDEYYRGVTRMIAPHPNSTEATT